MKNKYTVTLDESIVEETKKRNMPLSTTINKLLAAWLERLRQKEQVSEQEITEEYIRLKARYGGKTKEQIEILISFVNNSQMERKEKEITFQALHRLKESKDAE